MGAKARWCRRSFVTTKFAFNVEGKGWKLSHEDIPQSVELMEENHRHQVSLWLFSCAGILFLVVSCWGFARLSEFGQSIFEPRPLFSSLPKSEDEWAREFERFISSPDFAKQRNPLGFTQQNFKQLFYWGWFHQQLCAVATVAYFVPWAYFSFTGAIPKKMQPTILALLALAGTQAYVASLLHQEPEHKPRGGPDPSAAYNQYFLHLVTTVALYAGTLWLGMTIKRIPTVPRGSTGLEDLRMLTLGMTALSLGAIHYGAKAVGPDATLVGKEWPTMKSQLAPLKEYLLLVSPSQLSHDDKMRAAHRLFAFTTVAVVFALTRRAAAKDLPAAVQKALFAVQVAVALQAAGGLTAVFYGPLVPTLAVHQGGGLAVLTTFLWLAFTLRMQPLVWL
eukprot:EG_transcript_11455